MPKKRTEDNQVTLSTGVVLEGWRVTSWLVGDELRKLKPPEPPRVYIESKGREEENPFDPAYLKALGEFEWERQEAIQRMVLWLGTRVVKKPKELAGPEDKPWLEYLDRLEALGRKVGPDPASRYVAWLRYWAAATPQDVLTVTRLVAGATGTPEEEVAEAAESFRGDQGGGVDLEVPPETPR